MHYTVMMMYKMLRWIRVIVSEQLKVIDASTNTDLLNFSDVDIQNVAVMEHPDVKTDEFETKDAENQGTVIEVDASTDMNTKLLGDKDVDTSTDGLDASLNQFRIEGFKDDDKPMQFYTGFPSCMCFMICYNYLGLAVAVLFYHERSCGKEASFEGHLKCLTPLNETFLTLCQLRLVLMEQDLAY